MRCVARLDVLHMDGQRMTILLDGKPAPNPPDLDGRVGDPVIPNEKRVLFWGSSPAELAEWLGAPGRHEVGAVICGVRSNSIWITPPGPTIESPPLAW